MIAAPIAVLFVSRDALNFGIIETLAAIILLTLFLLLAAFWRLRPLGNQSRAY
jgi:hypothetical protein